jgi:hypothetical protein
MGRAALRTAGNLFRPMDNYNGVDGGWRKPWLQAAERRKSAAVIGVGFGLGLLAARARQE